MNNWSKIIAALVVAAAATQVQAAALTTPNTFIAGEPAVAAEVNANFAAVETAVNTMDGQVTVNADTLTQVLNRLDTLETQLATAQDEITTLRGNSVLELDGMLTYDTSGTYPAAVFSGINVQVVNGQNDTETTNGTGNLIIGYNETISTAPDTCSDGNYGVDQATCESNGGVWGNNLRNGSHYLVVGTGHSYTQSAGVVAGAANAATRGFASVVGGYGNIARGIISSVSGGFRNSSSGTYSSISGGIFNNASGNYSSVSGGSGNTASGDQSSASGGYNNTASGESSSISGGSTNTANNAHSSVGGGSRNTASAIYSSISGGYNNTASGSSSSVSGGYTNKASALYSSVSGGSNHEATGDYDWRAGTLFEDQ